MNVMQQSEYAWWYMPIKHTILKIVEKKQKWISQHPTMESCLYVLFSKVSTFCIQTKWFNIWQGKSGSILSKGSVSD